eukprot:g3933.t1 g3933   contig14:34488-35096(+)
MAEPPKLLELLGQQLQPMEILDETDAAESSADSSASAVEQILECQKQFYVVLTASNDESKMKTLFEDTPAAEVDEVLTEGGRIDNWSKCLERGARPEGMVISGSDVWISSNTLAYSTCIEFPSNAGIDGATLLAVQRWGRESEGAEWKLELHQTILGQQDRGLVVHFVVIAVVVLRWLGVLIEERLAVLSDEISLLKEITQV